MHAKCSRAGYVQALPRSDATGLLAACGVSLVHPRPDVPGEVHTVIPDPQGHQVRHEYMSHLMRGPARADVAGIVTTYLPAPQYPALLTVLA